MPKSSVTIPKRPVTFIRNTHNGIDLAEQVLKLRPTQRIALMTGYADGLERAKATGVTILSKPFNIDDLQALLVEVEH